MSCLFISFQIQKEHQWLHAKKKWGLDCLAYSTKFVLWPGVVDNVCGITSRTLLIVEQCISRNKYHLPFCLASSALTKLFYGAAFFFYILLDIINQTKGLFFSRNTRKKYIWHTDCPNTRDSMACLNYYYILSTFENKSSRCCECASAVFNWSAWMLCLKYSTLYFRFQVSETLCISTGEGVIFVEYRCFLGHQT